MQKKTIAIAAMVLTTAGAGIALAAGNGAMQDGMGGPGGPGHGRMSFEALDTDGSGEITADDFAAARAKRFAEYDSNGDGTVTEDEFVAYAEKQAAERAKQMFSRLDADGDGKLSRDVLESRLGGGGAMAERMLARLDTDGSGGVSKDEFDAAMKRLAEMRHQGGDGKWGRRRN